MVHLCGLPQFRSNLSRQSHKQRANSSESTCHSSRFGRDRKESKLGRRCLLSNKNSLPGLRTSSDWRAQGSAFPTSNGGGRAMRSSVCARCARGQTRCFSGWWGDRPARCSVTSKASKYEVVGYESRTPKRPGALPLQIQSSAQTSSYMKWPFILWLFLNSDLNISAKTYIYIHYMCLLNWSHPVKTSSLSWYFYPQPQASQFPTFKEVHKEFKWIFGEQRKGNTKTLNCLHQNIELARQLGSEWLQKGMSLAVQSSTMSPGTCWSRFSQFLSYPSP